MRPNDKAWEPFCGVSRSSSIFFFSCTATFSSRSFCFIVVIIVNIRFGLLVFPVHVGFSVRVLPILVGHQWILHCTFPPCILAFLIDQLRRCKLVLIVHSDQL